MIPYYTKKDLKTHLESIIPKGYSINNPSTTERFHFTKVESDKKIWIELVDTTDFPIEVNFMGVINLLVAFNEVEDIFDYACQNSTNSPFTHDDNDFTIQIALNPDGGQNEIMMIRENDVNNDESFKKIQPNLEKLIEKGLDYLKSSSTLSDWFRYIETLTKDEKFYAISHPFNARYLILKKLFNQSDYDSYANTIINHFTTQGETAKANFFQVLKNKLDNI